MRVTVGRFEAESSPLSRFAIGQAQLGFAMYRTVISLYTLNHAIRAFFCSCEAKHMKRYAFGTFDRTHIQMSDLERSTGMVMYV